MANKKLRFSLKAKILFLFLLIVLVSNTVLGIITFKTSAKNLTESVNKQLGAVANDLANQIAAINKKELAVLQTLADLDIIRDPEISMQEKQDHLTSVLKKMDSKYENLAFYDAEGNAIVAAGKIINFKQRPYFYEAYAGKNFISDPAFSTVTNSVLQHYSVPVRDFNNNIIGAIVLVINGNALYDTIKDIDLGGGMHPAVISRRTGITIANANENTGEDSIEGELDPKSGLGLVISHVSSGLTGQEDFVDPSIGMHVIAAYQPVPNIEWSVFAVAPYDLYFAALKQMNFSFVTIIVVTMIISALLGILTVGVLIRPLGSVKKSITEIASGNADLTQRIPQASNDEIGDVVTGFNQFVEKLQNIVKNLLDSKNDLEVIDGDLQSSTQDASASITQIIANIESVNGQILNQANSVQETAGAVNEISSNIESLEKMIEHQADGVQQASSAVEEMIGNINSVNSAVGKMISSFSLLEQNTKFGINSQQSANAKILEIDAQSKMLQDANKAIASISQQTNLLAMNAAIEAAHAGEAGKGFSVVADEIRKLSETSATQSKTIGAELTKIQDTIKTVVEASSETNTAFTSVTESISATNQIIDQIKSAMEEQQIGSKQIIDALGDMNNSTSEVKVASAEMTEGNKQILSEISKLQNATDIIKQSVQEMQVGAQRINDTGAALTNISSKVSGSITQIGDEIGLFKV